MHSLLPPAGVGNYFLICMLAASWPSVATSQRSAWCVITHVGNSGLDLGIDMANKGKNRHLVDIAVLSVMYLLANEDTFGQRRIDSVLTDDSKAQAALFIYHTSCSCKQFLPVRQSTLDQAKVWFALEVKSAGWYELQAQVIYVVPQTLKSTASPTAPSGLNLLQNTTSP